MALFAKEPFKTETFASIFRAIALFRAPAAPRFQITIEHFLIALLALIPCFAFTGANQGIARAMVPTHFIRAVVIDHLVQICEINLHIVAIELSVTAVGAQKSTIALTNTGFDIAYPIAAVAVEAKPSAVKLRVPAILSGIALETLTQLGLGVAATSQLAAARNRGQRAVVLKELAKLPVVVGVALANIVFTRAMAGARVLLNGAALLLNVAVLARIAIFAFTQPATGITDPHARAPAVELS